MAQDSMKSDSRGACENEPIYNKREGKTFFGVGLFLGSCFSLITSATTLGYIYGSSTSLTQRDYLMEQVDIRIQQESIEDLIAINKPIVDYYRKRIESVFEKIRALDEQSIEPLHTFIRKYDALKILLFDDLNDMAQFEILRTKNAECKLLKIRDKQPCVELDEMVLEIDSFRKAITLWDRALEGKKFYFENRTHRKQDGLEVPPNLQLDSEDLNDLDI
ncbi:MAG: hypothetical protein WAZ18_02605 [Alphaproteobacteria bacterium]